MSFDESMGLHVAITAADESAGAALADINERLTQLEKSFRKSGSAATGTNEDVQRLAERFGVLGRAAADVHPQLQKLDESLKNLGSGATPIGGVASKIQGLGGLLGGIPGPAMAAGAAIAGIGAASAFLVSAAHKAAEFQSAAVQLRLALRSAGETQAGLTRKLEEFAEAQEATTTYTRTQVVDSLAQLTTAGMNAAQAQAAMVAAENVAARTHVDVNRVVRSLEMAYHGNTASLQRYGIQVKDAHGKILPFADSMRLLERRFRGAAEAAGEAGEGPMIRLRNAFETLQQKIGALVLPILQKLADTLIWLIGVAETQFHKWEDTAHRWYLRNKEAFDAIAKVVKIAWEAIKLDFQTAVAVIGGYVKAWVGALMDTFTLFADLFTGHANRLWADVKAIFVDAWHNLTSGFGNFGSDLVQIARNIAAAVAQAFEAPFKAMGDALHGHFSAARADLQHAFSGFGSTNLMAGVHPLAGGVFGGGSAAHAGVDWGAPQSGGFWSGAAAPLSRGAGHHAGAAAHREAAKAAKEARDALRALTLQEREYIAQIELEAKQHKITIEQEIADLKRYEQTHHLTLQQRIALDGKIASLEQQAAKQKASDEAKREKAHAHALQSEYQQLVRTLNLELAAHTATYAQMERQLRAWVAQHRDASQAIITDAQTRIAHLNDLAQRQEQQQERALQREQAAWQRYYQAISQEAQRWADKFQPLFDSLFEHTTRTFTRGKHHFTEMVSAWHNELKKFLDQAKQALEKSLFFELFYGGLSGGRGAPNFMQVFMQNMGLAHGAGPQAPGGVPPGGGPMSFLGAAAGFLGLGRATSAMGIGGSPAAQAGAAGALSGGIIGALLGTASATQIASAIPTSSIMTMLFGVGAPTGTTGSTSSAGALAGLIASLSGLSAGTGSAAAAGATGGAGVLGSVGKSGIGGILSGGIPSIKGAIGGIGSFFGQTVSIGPLGAFGSATIGSLLLAGLGGYALGDVLGGAVFKNQPFNQGTKIGGALGGIAGALFGASGAAALGLSLGAFAGPVGAIAGAILGTLIGGLFGNHDNPANMPDKYNTQAFGQTIANLGGYGAGQNYKGYQNAVGMKGAYNANGTPFRENAQIASIAEGITAGMPGGPDPSEIAAIEVTLAKYGSKQNAPPWLQPLWDQLVGMFGISAAGAGKLHQGHMIGNVWITGASGVTYSSGNPASYTQMGNLANKFFEAYETQGSIGIGQPGTNPIYGGSGGSWFGTPFSAAYEIGTPGGALQPTDLSDMPSLDIAPTGSSGGVQMYPGGDVSGSIPSAPAGTVTPQPIVVGGGMRRYGAGFDGGLPPTRTPTAHGPSGPSTGPTVVSITIHNHVAGSVTTETELGEKMKEIMSRDLIDNALERQLALGGTGLH